MPARRPTRPKFLRDAAVSKNLIDANWLKINKALQGAKEETLLDALYTEITGRGRIQIIHRIFGAYSKTRKRREETDMYRWISDLREHEK